MTQICIKYNTLTCSQNINHKSSSNVPSLATSEMMTKQIVDYMFYQVMRKKGGKCNHYNMIIIYIICRGRTVWQLLKDFSQSPSSLWQPKKLFIEAVTKALVKLCPSTYFKSYLVNYFIKKINKKKFMVIYFKYIWMKKIILLLEYLIYEHVLVKKNLIVCDKAI